MDLGEVVEKRSVFRLGIIVDFFWTLLNVIGLFFGTMSTKTPTRKRKSERGDHNYRRGGGGGGGGGGDGGGGGGGGRRRRGPNIRTLEPSSSGCNGGPMGG